VSPRETVPAGIDPLDGGQPAILASEMDPAGMNILDRLEHLISRKAIDRPRIERISGMLITAEGLPDLLRPEPSYVIFASRHESESGLPCLTTHAPGNIGEAAHGGSPGRVSVAAPGPMKVALAALARFGSGAEYQVTVEATHHGPLTDTPCFFIEIGSRLQNWRDPAAGSFVAQAILQVIGGSQKLGPVAIGFGGPHYSERFTRLLLQTEYCLAHIVPKHQVGLVDEEALNHLLNRSSPRPSTAILDWKGMRGEDRRNLLGNLEGRGLPWVRLRDLLPKA
jgi:D-aminoacyl-tRNA deacylase